jgi:hypothetical protein
MNSIHQFSSSDKESTLTAHAGGLAFGFGNFGSNRGINAASNSIVAERNHQVTLSVTRSAPTDVTNTPYLRFTAWRDPAEVDPPANARFVVIGTSPDTNNLYGKNGFGPTDGDLANPTAIGFAITTQPQVFTIKLDDPAQFNLDKTYRDNARLFGQTQSTVNLTQLTRLAFGYYRTGADANTNLDPIQFRIDDIILNSKPAAFVTTVSANTVDIGSPATIDVVLDAMPSHDVVINATSTDSGIIGVSPSSLTFTPANWNTPQTITVTRVSNGSANVQFSKGATNDLLYASNAVSVPADVNFTVLPVSLSGMSVE